MRASDVSFVNEVRNHAAQFLHDNRTFQEAETLAWFLSGPDVCYWIINFRDDRIGYFRATPQMPSVIQIGADLHPHWQGRGLAKAAYSRFAAEVLLPLGFEKATLRVLKSNARALSLYRALGFEEVSETKTDLEMENDIQCLIDQQT